MVYPACLQSNKWDSVKCCQSTLKKYIQEILNEVIGSQEEAESKHVIGYMELQWVKRCYKGKRMWTPQYFVICIHISDEAAVWTFCLLLLVVRVTAHTLVITSACSPFISECSREQAPQP